MNVKNRTIFKGDNLYILRGLDTETVDLIYLDPPFNSNRTYEAPIGSAAAGAAFKDSWTLSDVDNAWHGEIAERQPALYQAICAAELTHGKSMKSYLIMMAVRMLEMKRVLKPTGSIYLHCDPTASHYLKVLMDAVFGVKQFRNEVVWQRVVTSKGNLTRGLARDSDIILRYSKTDDYIWNTDAVIIPYDMNNLDDKTKKQYSHIEPKTKRRYSLTALNAPTESDNPDYTYELMGVVRSWRWSKERMEKEVKAGRIVQTRSGNVPRYKRYLDEQKGKPLNNIWIDIPNLTGSNKERTGYPTQKPIALLDRIIKASSNPDDVVLDPFCGCATTCVAAERLQRQWIGIDISPKAIELVRMRLEKEVGFFGEVIAREDIPKRSEKLPNYRTHKHTLYGKQEGLCNGCQTQFPFRNMTIDHIVPQSKGGTDHADNLQLLCGACNSTKGTGTQAEMISKLRENGVID